MIQVDNLTKFFGPVRAVYRVNFQVDKGEIVGFLGPNGAGKTTTMRILTSWLPATSGVAKVAGYDVMTESMEVRRRIGYLPESVPLYTEMRVEEYLDYRAKLKGVPRAERQNRIDHCMEKCRVREVRRRLIGTLSKGYKQRVGLADTLVHDPPILILDEPTAGLDPIQIHQTLALIRELGEDHTILLSTHILSEVESVCDRVLIINGGRLSYARTMDDLETETIVLLEVRGPKKEIIDFLKKSEGVTGVVSKKIEEDVTGFEVKSKEDVDVREKLSMALAKKGWPIRHLELKQRTLEDAFFEVIREDDPLKEAITEKSPRPKKSSENIEEQAE